MPLEFEDYRKKASDLFDDHHHAGSLSFKNSGKVGNGDATYELNVSNAVGGGQPVEWNVDVSAGSFSMNHDHEGNISKKLDFCVKQVPGLNLSWEPAFNQKSGMSLGSLSTKYTNDKVAANIKMCLGKPDNADFDISLAPFKGHCSDMNLGLKGNLSASGLGDASYGMNITKGDLEMGFHSNNLTSQFGTGSIYKFLPGNKNFCCYGVQADTTEGSLALALASGCCSNSWRYKIDNKGVFSVAKVSKINKQVGLTVSAALNATNLAAGGHNFGMHLNFEWTS